MFRQVLRFGMRQCRFCENPADSREHYVPDWILQIIDIQVGASRVVGDSPPISFSGSRKNFRVRSVCGDCNGGWMSKLEQDSKPTIGPLLRGSDIVTPIDTAQQSVVARWAVKTAMVNETTAPPPPKIGSYFYTKDECERLRLTSSIPPKTIVWIGKFTGVGLFGRGTHVWDNGEKHAIHKTVTCGHIFTIVLDHLVLQVLTVHVSPEDGATSFTIPQHDAPEPFGNWTELLVPIWPIVGTVWWPPSRNFTENESSIGALFNRFKTGRKA
jgi:hypothetical protein